MEQNLNTQEVVVEDCFKLEFKGQNVEKTHEFTKWYKRISNYIKEENIRRAQDYLTKDKIYEVLEADDGLWEIINDKGEFCYYSPSNFEVVETYNETYCF